MFVAYHNLIELYNVLYCDVYFAEITDVEVTSYDKRFNQYCAVTFIKNIFNVEKSDLDFYTVYKNKDQSVRYIYLDENNGSPIVKHFPAHYVAPHDFIYDMVKDKRCTITDAIKLLEL